MEWYYYLIIACGLCLAAIVAVVLYRTSKFKPIEKPTKQGAEVKVDIAESSERFAELIRCKTISYRDKEREDEGEFKKLYEVVKKNYPTVFATCEFMTPSDRSMLFKWKGKNAGGVTVLMSHYDVVPANVDKWDKPAFEGIIEDGKIWGRGTLDTKCTLFSILESAEQLMKSGFVPERDIYFAFAGNEEIGGYGAPANVKYFTDNNIKIDLVLDEGGAVVKGVFPGVQRPCALIGTAEKGKTELHFMIASKGGHASAPPKHTPVGVLAGVVKKLESYTFPAYFGGAAGQMFDTLARHSSFLMRMLFGNLWLFKPLLSLYTSMFGGEMNALVRTTAAFTMMKGSDAINVIPPVADVGADYRLSTGSTVEGTIAKLKKVINDDNVKIYTKEEANPSPVSTIDSEGYKVLEETITETWQDAIVSPYLMIACSDSKHFAKISDKVYRFSPMAVTGEERKMIHGNNERIPLETLANAVRFYTRLIQKR